MFSDDFWASVERRSQEARAAARAEIGELERRLAAEGEEAEASEQRIDALLVAEIFAKYLARHINGVWVPELHRAWGPSTADLYQIERAVESCDEVLLRFVDSLGQSIEILQWAGPVLTKTERRVAGTFKEVREIRDAQVVEVRAREVASGLTNSDVVLRERSLTHDESLVAALVAQGLSNSEIGERLGILPRTVRSHLSHALQKLQLTSRVALVVWWGQNKDPIGPLAAQAVATSGYRGPNVCKIVGIGHRQLDYWVRTGLATSSLQPAMGSGSQRLYSFEDLIELSLIKKLIDAGVSLQRVREAIDYLRTLGSDLSGVTLVSNGASIFACHSDQEVVDVLRRGQGVFGIAIGPVIDGLRESVFGLPPVEVDWSGGPRRGGTPGQHPAPGDVERVGDVATARSGVNR